MLNERILNSVGRQNYKMYIIITNGKEIDEILDSRSPVFELYKYRDKLLDDNVGQDIDVYELEEFLQNNNDIRLKQQLENLFLESLSNSKFKIIKDMLVNHTFGWNISRLVKIHKEYKDYRIFRLLSVEYKDWLNITDNLLSENGASIHDSRYKINCNDIKRINEDYCGKDDRYRDVEIKTTNDNILIWQE